MFPYIAKKYEIIPKITKRNLRLFISGDNVNESVNLSNKPNSNDTITCGCSYLHLTRLTFAQKSHKRVASSSETPPLSVTSCCEYEEPAHTKRIRLVIPMLRKKVTFREIDYSKDDLFIKLESQLSVLYSNRGKKSKCKELKEHELTSHTSQGDVSQAPSTGVRRRGKRRRNRGGGRLTSAILVAQGSQDPETQVAGIGTESVNDSSRNSVAGQIGETDELVLPSVRRKSKSTKKVNSFLDESILKYLHRDVDKEAIEMEFDPKRRLVLEEAYRTKPDRVMSEEVQSLIKELKITTQCLGSWLHIPNVLSRKNSQFSLPFDTYELEILTPMKYAAQYVTSKHSKQLLYLTVLQKFKPNCYEMPIQNLEEGLILMMGGVLTENKVEQFKLIMDWNDYSDHLDKYETLKKKFIDENDGYGDFDNTKSINEYERCIKFKTWCGLCAICERMYGKFKSRDIDPPEGIEVTDFSTIDKKLSSLNIHKGLVEVLKCIQTY